MDRFRGIDSIRFICALIVVFGHIGPPIKFYTLIHTSIAKTIDSAGGVLFNGPAAVIVFFVVSGFCIHYPYRNASQVSIVPYYTRRIIRIGVPALLALPIYFFVGVPLKPPAYQIFWSVICELIYYLIYPALLAIRYKFDWKKQIVLTYLIAVSIMLSNLDQLSAESNSYVAMGNYTWLMGLPCWLLGCWLAENYSRFPSVSTSTIWIARLILFAASVGLRIVKFHVHSVFASNLFTLNVMAIFVCFWLGFEIIYFQKHKVTEWLEDAGKWSYSLYLIHVTIARMLNMMGGSIVPASVLTLVRLVLALGISYLFFRVVEKPAHELAKYLGKRLKPATTIA